MKQFIFPELPKGVRICAVYKMIFDGGYYYIGSATNIKQRMWGWKFKLNNGVDKNYKVTEAFKNTSMVVFEILEIIEDPALRKFREDGYIKINFGKPFCLNIASNAYNNKGIKQNPNKKKNKNGFQPVVKINDNGEIIDRYLSIAEAEMENGTSSVSDCFKDCRRKVKGMIFRKLDANGNIIPAQIPEPKPKKARKRKKGYHLSEDAKQRLRERTALKMASPDYKPPLHSKKIAQYDLNGVLIKEHFSIGSAAKSVNADSRNFKRQIKKSPRSYYKGFLFKYI